MASPAAPSPRPLRVLAFPGLLTNAGIMRAKLEPIRHAVGNCEFTVVEPLIVINWPTVSSTDADAEHAIAPAPGQELRVWWIPDDNKEHCDHFPRLDDLIAYFRVILETHGPFDAILGFSQGAAAAALLMALINQPSLHPEFARAGGENWPPKQFQFAIMASGFLPMDGRVASWFDTPLDVPSLHVLGSRDIVVSSPTSLALAHSFVKPRIESHAGGHFIPTQPASCALYKSFVTAVEATLATPTLSLSVPIATEGDNATLTTHEKPGPITRLINPQLDATMPVSDHRSVGALKAFLDGHEKLDPPSPGEWSLRNGVPPPIGQFLQNLDFEHNTDDAAQAIKLLEDFIKPWDEESLPEGPMTATHIAYTASCGKFHLLQGIDALRWTLVKLYRYSRPTRISEAAGHAWKMLELALCIREVENFQHGTNNPLTDPELFIYAGVSCECAATTKKEHKKAEKILKDIFAKSAAIASIGPKNVLWGKAALERAIRAQGKEQEADAEEDKLVAHLKGVRGKFTHAGLRDLLLAPGTTSNNLLSRLGVPEAGVAAPEKKVTVKAASKAHDRCQKCFDVGLNGPLKLCAVCRTVSYCSRECQKADWKEHKAHCKTMTDLAAKLEEVSLVKETRNELSMFEDLTTWCRLMREATTQACLSAFDLTTTRSKISTHILVVTCHWNGLAKKEVDYYDFATAKLVPNAQFDKLTPGNRSVRQKLDETISAEPETQLGMTYVRVQVLGSKKGRESQGYQVLLMPSYGGHQMERADHDADWFATLKTKVTKNEAFY
ncbi:hypothetical protein RQP46_007902 [Phenoliferia psychrophenolica]